MKDPTNNDQFSKRYRRVRILRPRSILSWKAQEKAPWDDSEEEDPEEPFDPSAALRQHPLARAPGWESFRAPLGFYLGILCCSLIYWKNLPADAWTARQDLIFQKGEYWRCLSSLLVHADLAHFLSNSTLFLLFAWFLRHAFGKLAFPLLSILGGGLTMGLTVLTYPPHVRLLGASGMVYFMNGLWLWLFLAHADYLKLSHRVARVIAFTLVVLVPTQFDPAVSYRSHAIGFGLGLVCGALFSRRLKPKNPQVEN